MALITVGALIGDDYSTIEAAVDAARGGDTIIIADGTYTLTSALVIVKALTIIGTSEAGVVIDVSDFSGYGILVTADNVDLSRFTLEGPAAVARTPIVSRYSRIRATLPTGSSISR